MTDRMVAPSCEAKPAVTGPRGVVQRLSREYGDKRSAGERAFPARLLRTDGAEARAGAVAEGFTRWLALRGNVPRQSRSQATGEMAVTWSLDEGGALAGAVYERCAR